MDIEQVAVDGKADGYGDLLGLEAKMVGRYGDYRLRANADISTFNPSNFMDGSRYWGSFGRDLDLGLLGTVKTELFGTYRYRSWNDHGKWDPDTASLAGQKVRDGRERAACGISGKEPQGLRHDGGC